MKSEILRLLKESDTYISGQQLCEQFQVSRTAIWKVIDQLKKEGYEIEAVRNKGYRLIDSPDVMSKAEIESLVDTKWAGKNVVYYDEIDSTNNRAKEAGDNGAAHGTLFVADMQVAGKGRRGRVWKSPSGSSIYMTILLYPDIPPVKAPQLTLLMAIAVAEGIQEVTGLETKIKWPNDIVVNGRKICGILTEMSTEIDYINHVLIGAGINVNQDTFSDDIKATASSLKLELGKSVKRSELIAAVMKSFEKCYEIFIKTEDLSGLQELYNSMLVNRDQEVKVLEPGNEYKAHAIGINQTGELIVRTPDGKEKEIYAGEVSVRGVYGYDEKVVLCGANSYEEKYYLNPDFEQLPDDVKNELKIMCVLYVHDVGGILTLVFEENGELCFEVTSDDFDPMFDDIGSQLKIKQLQRDKQDLLQALQLYYKVFFLGEEINSEE